ncbi:hypothetical protein HYW76_00225 [Candidatus Pacearchaeota archaeon]|nr:hypothetical protein [Candidatus Pacearchaeota archaeon]
MENEIVNAMKAEIKALKNQFEKKKAELHNLKRDLYRKQRAMTLFIGEDKKRFENPVVQIVAQK